MSDVFAKRQPMIDFTEFERSLCPHRGIDQKVGDLLAELLRITGNNDEPHETDFEPKAQLSARTRLDAAEPGEWRQSYAQLQPRGGDVAATKAGLFGATQPKKASLRPNPPAPLISGDFAAIEAGLLSALQEQVTATVSGSDTSDAFPSVNLGTGCRPYRHRQPTPRHGSLAKGQKRAWRSLRVSVAIAFVGMAGTAVIFGLNSRPSEPEIASIRADGGPDKQQTEATSSAAVPPQDASILSKPPEPSPRVLVNGKERTFDLPQAEEKTLLADSRAQLDNGLAPVLAEAVQAPKPAEPLSAAAPVESNGVKTDLVPPDASQQPSGAPPEANINGAELPAGQSPAATQAPAAKAAEQLAKPQKRAAAKHRRGHGQLHQIANKAKPAPMSPLATEPAPGASPEAGSPNGALESLQKAVNSLTSTVGKLFGGTD